METLDNFRDKATDLQLVEHLLLVEAGVDDFVEFEIFGLSTLPVTSLLLLDSRQVKEILLGGSDHTSGALT